MSIWPTPSGARIEPELLHLLRTIDVPPHTNKQTPDAIPHAVTTVPANYPSAPRMKSCCMGKVGVARGVSGIGQSHGSQISGLGVLPTRSVKDVVKKVLQLKREVHRRGLILALHAEENALRQYQAKIPLRGQKRIRPRKLHMVVIRIDSLDQLTESKPCTHCIEVMRNYGIRKVTYSTKDGQTITEFLHTIVSEHSRGYRSVERVLQVLDEALLYYQARNQTT